MRDLIAGERAPISGERTFALVGDGPILPALALIGLDAQRQTAAAFPQIDSVTREMRPAARFDEPHRLSLDLAAMPGEVERLLLVAFDRASRPIAATIAVKIGDDLRFSIDLADRADAAVILVECYRHQDAWRLAANGQGFVMGLSAIAAMHGIDRDWVQRLLPRLDPPEREFAGGHERQRGGGNSSGSGVAIDRNHILTNAHVIEDARAITVHVMGRPQPAMTVFADPRNDLALVRVDTPMAANAQFRSQIGLHLGEDVVALGFPLQGLLGTGPQASAGNIAALCGIGNDSTVFQFTAPIASGNSGGPILDTAGHLVGLVSSSLNLDRIRQSGGSAENINFGIKGAVMLSFLDAFGIEPPMAGIDPMIIGRAAVVRQARETIVRIACEC